MKRKQIKRLIALLAAMLCLFSALMLCGCEKETAEAESSEIEIDGGLIDDYEPTSYVPIESKDIKFFEVCFDNTSCVYPDESKEYLYGNYTMTLEKTENAARYSISCSGYDKIELSSDCDASALTDLQQLIDEKEIARLNGWYKRDSALGCNFSLSVEYESGESISAAGEGGFAVLPDKYWNETWFLDFFEQLAADNGQTLFKNVDAEDNWS